MPFSGTAGREKLELTDRVAEKAGITTVTIYGRTYNLRGDGDPAYLARLAHLVDQKMREVADSTGTADTMKVAILAALNLADEYQRSTFPADLGEGTPYSAQIDRMIELLDEVLE